MITPDAVGGLSFRIAAIMICVTCLFYTAVMRGYVKKRLRSRLFNMLLMMTIICSLMGIISSAAYDTHLPVRVSFYIIYIGRFVYYTIHLAFTPVLALYIMMVCDVFYKLDNVKLFTFNIPFVFLELAVFTNPFTEFVFSVSDTLNYRRGPGVYVAYFISAIYIAFCVFLLARYRKNMDKLQKVALSYFLGMAFLGTVIQMLVPMVVSELLAEAIGLMGIMIMIEKDDYRMDYRTSACNRSALSHDLKSFLDVKRSFYVICVRLMNDEAYRRIMGHENYDIIVSRIADFLRSINYHFDVYRTTGGNFIMLCPGIKEDEVENILGKIENRFNESFEVTNGSANVMVKILCAKCPEEFSDADDVLLLEESNVFDNPKTVLRGSDINFLLRKIDVEKAIVRGISQNTFKVLYRPVLEKKTLRIAATEAILTLKDSVLGDVDFGEFMSVAEETGFVFELQYRMIESVIAFVKEEILEKNILINGVVIHIVSVQALTRELAERVKACIDKYTVNPSLILFDVSDTIALQAQDVLRQVIDDFAAIGIPFVLVNDEIGLLGLDQSMTDKFYGVAINAKRQYQDVPLEQADEILRNRFSMVHELGKTTTITGLDTKVLFEMVKDIPADFVAGDYLKGIVSKEEMAELLKTSSFMM